MVTYTMKYMTQSCDTLQNSASVFVNPLYFVPWVKVFTKNSGYTYQLIFST